MSGAKSSISIEMERDQNVPQKFIDIISCDFTYDPIRLPLQQDPTKSLYDRKTLETIWETRHQAQNPFTRNWFDIKSVVPQIELRQEMEQYIQLNKFPADAELEVIAEYALILDGERMQRYLKACICESQMLITEQLWKKINLVRLCCQFNPENIKTFRRLNGYKYLETVIWEAYLEVLTEKAVEGVSNICRELVRLVDVIGLTSSDMVGENAIGFHVIMALIPIIHHVFFHTHGYMKIDTLVLRVVSVIFDTLAAETFQVLGDVIYSEYLKTVGVATALVKFIEPNARDISSEDLNHGLAILRRAWIKDHDLLTCFFGHHWDVLVNGLMVCIAREIEGWDDDAPGISEGQLHEAEQQAGHNCLALEKGLLLLKDILIDERYASGLRVVDILDYIIGMFKRFSENESMGDPQLKVFHGQKRRKGSEDVHFRIAQLGLEMSEALLKSGGPQLDVEVLHKFLKS